MAKLTDLAAELILQICEQLSSDDFVHLLQVSKGVNRSAQIFLPEFRKLLQLYTPTTLDGVNCANHRNGWHLPSFTKRLLAKPTDAKYVRSLTIHHWNNFGKTYEDFRRSGEKEALYRLTKEIRTFLEDESTIAAFRERCNIVADESFPWLAPISTGNQSTLIRALPLLLPSLRTLNLTEITTHRNNGLTETIVHIVKHPRLNLLTQLTTANMSFVGSQYEKSLCLVFALAQLLSMREIHTDGLVTKEKFTISYPTGLMPFTSNLTVLSFQNAVIDFSFLQKSLRCFPALRTFEFSTPTHQDDPISAIWSAGELRQQDDEEGSALQEIVIRLDCWSRRSFVGFFEPPEGLREAELDFDIFGMHHDHHDHHHHHGCPFNCELETKIASLLSPSVERVTIRYKAEDAPFLRTLLLEMGTSKAKSLHKLRHLHFLKCEDTAGGGSPELESAEDLENQTLFKESDTRQMAAIGITLTWD